jgi:hypothetical protein
MQCRFAEPGPLQMLRSVTAPDQQRTAPQQRRDAQHPGHAPLWRLFDPDREVE